jgi:opacity protein-like surface antigen
MSRRVLLPLVAVLALAFAAPARAARWEAGGHLVVAQPTGEFSQVAGTGFGLQGFGVLNIDAAGMFGIRVDAGFVNYGSEDYDVPFSGTVPVTVRVSTTNNIGMFGIGPQFGVPTGPVRPYAYGTIGAGLFFTETSVKNRNGGEEIASETNQSDGAFSWSVGGGVRIPVARTVRIDLGAEYRAHAEAEYLTEGGLSQDPDTNDIIADLHRSEANLVLYRIGVTVSSPF